MHHPQLPLDTQGRRRRYTAGPANAVPLSESLRRRRTTSQSETERGVHAVCTSYFGSFGMVGSYTILVN